MGPLTEAPRGRLRLSLQQSLPAGVVGFGPPRGAEQSGLQSSRQEDPEPVGDLESLQSVIQQALAAAFPQPHPQPTSVLRPSPSGDFYSPSATLPNGGTPTSSML